MLSSCFKNTLVLLLRNHPLYLLQQVGVVSSFFLRPHLSFMVVLPTHSYHIHVPGCSRSLEQSLRDRKLTREPECLNMGIVLLDVWQFARYLISCSFLCMPFHMHFILSLSLSLPPNSVIKIEFIIIGLFQEKKESSQFR